MTLRAWMAASFAAALLMAGATGAPARAISVTPGWGAAPMNRAHGSLGVLLADGRVLVPDGAAASEIYDPKTGKWSFAAAMNVRRTLFTATLLRTGKVL